MKLLIDQNAWFRLKDHLKSEVSIYHHLAFNHWAGPDLLKHKESNLGLNFLTIEYSDQVLFEATLTKAQLHGMTIIEKEKTNYLLEDQDGIRTLVPLITS